MLTILSLLGNLASIAGIGIALYQIFKIKDSTEQAQIAIENTRHDIERIFSIADITKSNETIKLIQESLTLRKYEVALFRLRELKLMIIELREIPLLNTEDFKSKVSEIIISLGIDVMSLHNCIMSSINLKPDVVMEHLELTSELLTEIKSKLKYKSYE